MENVNKLEAEGLFSELAREKGNDRCFDCNKCGPTWISIRHAVFVCTECAAKHRALGLRLKSVLLDTFTRSDLKRIKLGGNFRFENGEFTVKYGKLRDLPAELDRLVDTTTYEDAFSAEAGDERRDTAPGLVVKRRGVSKFGQKTPKFEKKCTEKRAEQAPPQNEKAPVPQKAKSVVISRQEGPAVSRKEYKIGGASRNRMGFGASKIKDAKKEEE